MLLLCQFIVVNLNVIIFFINMYIFVKFDCKDLKQYDFPYMDNKFI